MIPKNNSNSFVQEKNASKEFGKIQFCDRG